MNDNEQDKLNNENQLQENKEQVKKEEPVKAKPSVDISSLMSKKTQKSSFYGGGSMSGNKNYNSRHGISTQKNHRVKHG